MYSVNLHFCKKYFKIIKPRLLKFEKSVIEVFIFVMLNKKNNVFTSLM